MVDLAWGMVPELSFVEENEGGEVGDERVWLDVRGSSSVSLVYPSSLGELSVLDRDMSGSSSSSEWWDTVTRGYMRRLEMASEAEGEDRYMLSLRCDGRLCWRRCVGLKGEV